jgi:hypothetical protein
LRGSSVSSGAVARTEAEVTATNRITVIRAIALCMSVRVHVCKICVYVYERVGVRELGVVCECIYIYSCIHICYSVIRLCLTRSPAAVCVRARVRCAFVCSKFLFAINNLNTWCLRNFKCACVWCLRNFKCACVWCFDNFKCACVWSQATFLCSKSLCVVIYSFYVNHFRVSCSDVRIFVGFVSYVLALDRVVRDIWLPSFLVVIWLPSTVGVELNLEQKYSVLSTHMHPRVRRYMVGARLSTVWNLR